MTVSFGEEKLSHSLVTELKVSMPPTPYHLILNQFNLVQILTTHYNPVYYYPLITSVFQMDPLLAISLLKSHMYFCSRTVCDSSTIVMHQ
jgi:hypothetical protein